jgi:hypothetical protein
MAASQMKIKQRDTIWQVPILWKHNADVPLVEISTRHFLVFPFRRKEQALDQEVPINDPIESYSSFSSNPTHKHSLFCHPKNSQYRIMLSYECAEKRRLLLRILFTKTGPHLSKDEAQKLEAVMLPKSHFKWQEFIFCQYKWRDEVQRSVIVCKNSRGYQIVYRNDVKTFSFLNFPVLFTRVRFTPNSETYRGKKNHTLEVATFL